MEYEKIEAKVKIRSKTGLPKLQLLFEWNKISLSSLRIDKNEEK